MAREKCNSTGLALAHQWPGPRSLRAVAALGVSALVSAVLSACSPKEHDRNPLGANAGCYVCHMTFVKEELSRVHLAAGVGCARCHGPSAAHANDENIGATKPDITFSRAQVNPACRKCHPTHDADPAKIVARWAQVAAKKFAGHPPSSPACTDCHGTHKIARNP